MSSMVGLPPLYKYSATSAVPSWPDNKRGVSKPVALWLSVGDAWERWCHREKVFLEAVAWRRPVTINPGARVEVFDNMSDEFDAFTDRYTPVGEDTFRVPAWRKVAGDMDVLILWPWKRPRPVPYRWDMSWDCPSGVVFIPEVVVYGPPERRSPLAEATQPR